MKRASLLLPLLGWGLLLLNTVAAAQRPNVLLILADDLGFSDLGCYGGEIPTPNIDSLATNGLRFSQFYNSARCCPSRASLLTGLHPHQTGIGSFATARPAPQRGPAYTGHLLPTCATLAEILRQSGYSTWMVGKWHMGSPGPIDRGFQHYFGFKNFLDHSSDQWDPRNYTRLPPDAKPARSWPTGEFFATDAFSDYAIDFLHTASSEKDKPWFLYLAYSSPHFPIQAPQVSIDKYVDLYRKGWDILRAERLDRMKKLGLVPPSAALPARSVVPVDRDDIANGYPGQPNPAWDSLTADRREDLAWRMATYAAMVEHVDRGVGRIIADLKQRGQFENTLVLFLSDNGACYEWGPFGFDGPSRAGITTLHRGDDLRKIGQPGTHHSYGSAWAMLCNTPLSLYKHFCHEGGISTPFIVQWPAGGIKPGQWTHTPGHIMDIVPTVCELARVECPTTLNGQSITLVEGLSLTPLFAGHDLPERSLPFEHQLARALRRDDWKIVWGKRMSAEPAWELYNIKSDRAEQHNLADERPQLTRRLADEWVNWANKVGVDLQMRNSPRSTQNKRPQTGAPLPAD